jgi:hypothetical protein
MTAAEINRGLAECFSDNFRPIPGHPGYHISASGEIYSSKSSKVMSPGRCGKYLQIAFTNLGDKKVYRYLIHRLVADVFIGPCPDGMEVCHIDGNPHNNHVNNLKYATRKENAQHKFVHGTMPVGERNLAAKLTSEEVSSIRSEYVPGKHGVTSHHSLRGLAEKYGVGMTAIINVVKGKTWRDPAVLAAAALKTLRGEWE